MSRAPASRSWRVTRAALRTPAWAALAVIALLGSAELAARRPAVRAALPAPSLGTPSRRFDLQLATLERNARAWGGVECAALGNSAVLTGIDPAALERGYRAAGGRELRCGNFGIAGLTASEAAAVAAVLVDDFRPALLLYLVSARDVSSGVAGPRLSDAPWLRYRAGSFSASGWLVEHSAAFRYYLLYRQWLDPAQWQTVAGAANSSSGYLPLNKGVPLSERLLEQILRRSARVIGAPPSPAELAGYARLLALANRDTRIVVIETPAHPRVRAWAERMHPHESSERDLQTIADAHAVPFWRTPDGVIPADGWSDFTHLNARGAARLSEWIGRRLAAAK